MIEIEEYSSPNFDERGEHVRVDTLIFHYTGMQSAHEALLRLSDLSAQVSAHYLIDEDGKIYRMVDEIYRAWHAGVSHWRGEDNINARSIGIELVNPGHEWGYREFPKEQIKSLYLLSRNILERHHIPARNIIAHSDVAPTRKEDPGELFPWATMAQAGIGLWTDDFKEGDVDVMQGLQTLGYELNDPEKTLIAFQRHYIPEELGQGETPKTKARLAALLDLIGNAP